jgi:thioredoxin 1
MAGDHVLELTESNFSSEVLKSDQPVLVDFWAEWCQPCRRLAPAVDAVASAFAGRAKVGKVDIDSNREIAMQYGIQAIPTIMVFKGGEVVERFSGLRDQSELAGALEKALA